MISAKAVRCKLWHAWLWIVDLFEFLVLLTLGFHPARSILSLPGSSKETCEIVSTCLDVYSRSTVGSSLSQIKDLLSNCDSLSIAKLTTDDGYNLLQLAVQKSDIAFVEYLLSVKKVNPNICKCSLPLHIALSIGSVNMVQLLLSYKAKTHQQKGMCHPLPHVPVYSSHSKFFFVSPSMVCGGASKDAYQRAIDTDNVQLLEMFLQRKNSPRLNVMLLHYACDLCSLRSIKHLVEVWHADVNATDNRGYNAIMHSLNSDIEVIQYLVSQGAEVGSASYKSQTVLHQLFCDMGEVVPGTLEKTKLFLALGADDIVNNFDVYRNTALHYLCSKYAVFETSEHEEKLRHCLGLLLSHNADTSIVNSDGFLPIQSVLQCSCLNSHEIFGGRSDSLPAHTHQHPVSLGRADRIYSLLKLFTLYSPSSTHAAINKDNETCMFYILRMCFDYADQSYLSCMDLLQRNGANINHVAVTQSTGNTKPTRLSDIHTRSLISVVRDRALQELKMISDGNHEREDDAFLVSPILQTLFKSGLDPNSLQIECRTQSQAENVNSLACFSQIMQECHSSSQLRLVCDWLRICLQWGADPELQLFRPEPQICTSQGSIFLKQQTALPITQCFTDSMAHHWSKNRDIMKEVVLLLSNCMSHVTLQSTLAATTTSSTLLPQLSHRLSLSAGHLLSNGSSYDNDNYHFFNTLSSQPRTLESIASFQIYKTLRHRVYPELVNTLPLPTVLKSKISLL